MSNQQTLPVYVAPGADGNPDLYYLRSYPQSDGNTPADVQITQEQFDAINRAIGSAYSDGAASVTPGSAAQALVDQHAAVDPASPGFQGTPAVNAEVAGSAAAPVSQPTIDPGDPTIPAADPGDAPADQSQTESNEGSADTAASQPDQSEATTIDPGTEGQGTEAAAGVADEGTAVPDSGAVSEGSDAGTSETNPAGTDGATIPGDSSENQGTETSPEPVSEEQIPPVVDPNAGAGTQQTPESISPDQQGGTQDQSTSPDPNVQVSEDQPSGSDSQTTGSQEETSSQADNSSSGSDQLPPVVDPDNPSVVAGEPLPSSVTEAPATVDPSTGLTPDLSDHPVDSGTLPDPTVVQPPPADCPVEEHGSWFAKEKQRILDFLHSECLSA
jgi:hypothetical protein